LKNRLQGNISEPLHHLVDVMFPELGRRIEELQTALDDPDRAPSLRDAAQQQAQAMLLAMQKVRDHMIELEDFNEAIELLRNIVDMQKKLHNDTQKRHDQKIRDLLE
jgi:predicted trehalose synthase